jgi:hypothetical protein
MADQIDPEAGGAEDGGMDPGSARSSDEGQATQMAGSDITGARGITIPAAALVISVLGFLWGVVGRPPGPILGSDPASGSGSEYVCIELLWDDGSPAEVVLVGPDGSTRMADSWGIAWVPESWIGMTVSIRHLATRQQVDALPLRREPASSVIRVRLTRQ